MTTIAVDDLEFELRGSARRRSLQVTVDREGDLVLFAPPDCDRAVLEGFVRDKRFWIYRKLAEKEALRQPVSARQYLSGEGFPYLGRSYRLLLVDEQSVPVKLEEGRFKMRRSAANEGHRYMVRWYEDHAGPWLATRVERFGDRIGVRASSVAVRDLGYRWGSCGKGDKLYFHWRAVLLPPRIVEYVVVHELVHMLEPHHTPDFWLRVERAMPDFAARKQWLAERGHTTSAV
ncbi:MAG: M48 family metallopeptidase [Solirubrobacteraceae bacterium]